MHSRLYTNIQRLGRLSRRSAEMFCEHVLSAGRPRLSQFKKTIAFAESGEWESVAAEILDSRWAKQTPNRAQESRPLY